MLKPDVKDSKGMVIDGAFSSEAIDSSGEIVKLDGLDISLFEEGQATANYEHQGKEGMGKETVGHIIYVKKIFKPEDCEDARQRFYYKKAGEVPYLYGMIRLYDGAGHESAKALAAQIRDHVAHDEQILVRYSVEGTTLERDSNIIKTSIGRKVACTIIPCNKTCLSGLMVDANAPEGYEKNPEEILKSEILQDPTNKCIGGSINCECNPVLHDTETPLDRLVRGLELIKSITAGSYDAAPSTLTGGAALQKEDIQKRYKDHIVKAIADYDKPFDRKSFKSYLKDRLNKAALPDVSDSFLDHFMDIAQDYSVKKSEPLAKMALIHNDPNHPTTVYRVQNAQGEGPHRASNIADEAAEMIWRTGGKPNRPVPIADFNNDEWNFNPEKEKLRFGFESPEHAKHWFKESLPVLLTHGFNIVPVRASKVYRGESGKQVAFLPHESEKTLQIAKSDWDMSEDINKSDSLNITQLYNLKLKYEGLLIDLRKAIRSELEGYQINLPEIYQISILTGQNQYSPAGRFMIVDNQVKHLEDYHNILRDMLPEGPLTPFVETTIQALKTNPIFNVTESALPEAIKDKPVQMQVNKQELPKRASVFHYLRPGMVKPHVVEFGGDYAALDGSNLSLDELTLMLENARNGIASINWINTSGNGGQITQEDPLSKAEGEDKDGIDKAFAAIRQLVAQGHLSPEHEKALNAHVWQDSMSPGIGNKYAVTKHLNKNKPGVYASIDLNNFKHINDTMGHTQGDLAIKAAGNALKEAGESTGNMFVGRNGGDEYVIHAPTYEHMANFMRHATKNFDSLAPVGGLHKLSFSAGLGHNFETADKALYEAKKGKKDPLTGKDIYQKHNTPHFIHSLLPGNEGPVNSNTQEIKAPKAA